MVEGAMAEGCLVFEVGGAVALAVKGNSLEWRFQPLTTTSPAHATCPPAACIQSAARPASTAGISGINRFGLTRHLYIEATDRWKCAFIAQPLPLAHRTQGKPA